jgi:histidinol dehydrogenase
MEVVKKVRDRFRQKGDRAVRKMAKELDMSRTSFRTIVKNDLKLKS